MTEQISVVFLILTFVAEVLGTIGGFGSSVFFVPIANIYFDFHSVLGLTAIFHVASNLSKITLFRQGVNKSLIFYIGLP
ncbi:MAG: sulfite exporter TauE/SafE family protein, partial [Saprospiraceae bacterium]|nr:sulfite exporter TauE/SafE family protein [Saprospiraceae bacterium]